MRRTRMHDTRIRFSSRQRIFRIVAGHSDHQFIVVLVDDRGSSAASGSGSYPFRADVRAAMRFAGLRNTGRSLESRSMRLTGVSR